MFNSARHSWGRSNLGSFHESTKVTVRASALFLSSRVSTSSRCIAVFTFRDSLFGPGGATDLLYPFAYTSRAKFYNNKLWWLHHFACVTFHDVSWMWMPLLHLRGGRPLYRKARLCTWRRFCVHLDPLDLPRKQLQCMPERGQRWGLETVVAWLLPKSVMATLRVLLEVFKQQTQTGRKITGSSCALRWHKETMNLR